MAQDDETRAQAWRDEQVTRAVAIAGFTALLTPDPAQATDVQADWQPIISTAQRNGHGTDPDDKTKRQNNAENL